MYRQNLPADENRYIAIKDENGHHFVIKIEDITRIPIPDPHYACDDPNQEESNRDAFVKRQLVSGDPHSNELRLLWTMALHRIYIISPEDYELLVHLYYTPFKKWGEEEFKTKKELLTRIRENNHAKNEKILLIGDETCDRGEGDDATNMEIIHKKLTQMIQNKKLAAFTNLASNHGLENVCNFEWNVNGKEGSNRKKGFCTEVLLSPKYPKMRKSAFHMQDLIDQGKITIEEVEELITTYYLPNLKLIDYSVSLTNGVPNKITVYTHAPSGNQIWRGVINQFETKLKERNEENIILELRKKLDIKEITRFDPESFSIKDEVKLLKYINELFAVMRNKRIIHELLLETRYDEYGSPIYVGVDEDGNEIPNFLYWMVWGRTRNLRRDLKHCCYGNGHDPNENSFGSYELDCELGKNLLSSREEFRILYSYNDLFGNDLDDLLEGKPINKLTLDATWDYIKEDIIKTFRQNALTNEIKPNDENYQETDCNYFLTRALDSKFIYSYHRIKCLYHLLIENKQAFIDLFKNKESINYLNTIIHNNDMHILFDIIYYLMTHEAYSNHQNEIVLKVLELGDRYKNFDYLKKIYQFLLLLDELSKYILIDNWFFEVLNNETDGEQIARYHLNIHENFVNFIESNKLNENNRYFVDYLKLGVVSVEDDDDIVKQVSIYEGEDLEIACWVVKMVGLTCIPWNTPRPIRCDLMQQFVNCLSDLKLHNEEFDVVLLKSIIEIIPKKYLNLLCTYMQCGGQDGCEQVNFFISIANTIQSKDLAWPDPKVISAVIKMLCDYKPDDIDDDLLNLIYLSTDSSEDCKLLLLWLIKLTNSIQLNLLDHHQKNLISSAKQLAAIIKLNSLSSKQFSIILKCFNKIAENQPVDNIVIICSFLTTLIKKSANNELNEIIECLRNGSFFDTLQKQDKNEISDWLNQYFENFLNQYPTVNSFSQNFSYSIHPSILLPGNANNKMADNHKRTLDDNDDQKPKKKKNNQG